MKTTTALLLLPFLLIALPASAQVEHQILDPEPGSGGSMFGSTVALSSSRALIGAGLFGGSYLFEPQENGAWAEVASLEGGAGPYSRSVALDGDRALTGAIAYAASFGSPATGGAHVYERQEDGTWVKTATLTADDGAQDDQMGLSVALDGDRALVGAPGHNDNAGAAYVFERQADASWSQVAKLIPDDAEKRRQIGWFVALDGDRALVGCQGVLDAAEYIDNCVAYIFERQANGSWEQQAEIMTAESMNQFYGWSVALDDNLALVGTFATNQRAAYVYTGITPTPTEQELELPQTALLRASYPNPFNPRVTIPFAVSTSQHVRIQVYDVLGRAVATLVDGMRPVGEQTVTWEAAGLPSGAYLVRLTTGTTTQSRTVVLQK